jgi:ankyrin repeat protein
MYAALYWLDHVRFDDVSSSIEDAMDDFLTPPSRISRRGSGYMISTFRSGTFCLRRAQHDQGADMAALDYVSAIPLHKASDKGHLDVVEFILEHHVNVDARDGRAVSPR